MHVYIGSGDAYTLARVVFLVYMLSVMLCVMLSINVDQATCVIILLLLFLQQF